MALIFPHNQVNPSVFTDPRTHVLVIGLGGYSHLEGGNAPKEELREKIGILNQVTTAPRSAVAFADFVIEAADHWAVPLGSVEMLLTAKPGDEGAIPDGHPSGATSDMIQEAYDSWRKRCDSHKDNIAIFYFCGHGVEKNEQLLLTEDFGKSVSNPWRGAFALDSTVLGLRSCKAQTQCFFIDACREITSPLKNHDISAHPLDTPKLGQRENEFSFVLKSTAGKETALGPKNGVAYATQALIKALKGGAASSTGNQWVVRTGSIADKITDILGLIKEDENFGQRCPCSVTKSTELLRLEGKPTVSVNLACDSDEATQTATISCTRVVLPGESQPEIHTQSGQALNIEVEAGAYMAQAEFPSSEFSATNELLMASPPRIFQKLNCIQA